MRQQIDLWGLDLLCLSAPSITQVIRSEKWSEREQCVMMGLMDGRPRGSRCIAVLVPTNVTGTSATGNDRPE